jgi:glycosyltransferase involved in cell wall biosynthesis
VKILLVNFAECPENLHFEQALIRALSAEMTAKLDIVHDFRFPYSFIEKLPPPGGGRRVRYAALADLKRESAGWYDLLVVLDFAKRKACAAPFLWLIRNQACAKKIFIANHLSPMPGHSPTADIVRELALMSVFDRVYILESDDRTLWAEIGAGPEAIRTRGYAVDCRYYCPTAQRPFEAPGKHTGAKEDGSPRGYVFSAGSAGRDFSVLAQAVKKTGLMLKLFSDRDIPPFSADLRVAAFPLAKNLHNLRQAVRDARAVVIPLSDSHVNGSAGNSIAFLSMACGRPVIVRRTSYMERFIRDGGNGFFYESLSAASLARQLKRALSLDPAASRRLAKAARSTVLKKASLDAFARELAVMAVGLRASGQHAR